MALTWKVLLLVLALPATAREGRVPVPRASMAHLPLAFERNQGQADPGVRFLARGAGHTLLLRDREAALRVQTDTKAASLHLRYLDANPHPAMEAEQPLPGKVNYLLGKDPSQWRTGVPTSARVRYRDLYPGTDLVYYGQDGHLEYDFVLRAGADPSRIRLRVEGAEKLDFTPAGDLRIKVPGGELVQKRPEIYQERDGRRVPIEGRFRRIARNTLGFEVKGYDHSRELVVDPSLVWSTYLGGNLGEEVKALKLDGNNVIAAGYTYSSNFPVTAGAYQTALVITEGSDPDAFVAKFSADGSSLLWATYFGGDHGDEIDALAVDGGGNVIVAGWTGSTNLPTTAGAYQRSWGGGDDGFVAKFSADGSSLLWSTYLGGTINDYVSAMSLDSSGNLILAGRTFSTNFPTTAGAFQRVNTSTQGYAEGFVSKLSANGSSLLWSTYLGGSKWDVIDGLALDATGNAVVSGSSSSSNFPTTVGAYRTTLAGTLDSFVAKLSADGSRLLWSTLIGSISSANGGAKTSLAVDTGGNAVVASSSDSASFPTTPGAYQTTLAAGATNGVLTKLSADGSRLLWSTFLGGSGFDSAYALALDASGNPVVSGNAGSINFPITPGTYQGASGGGNSDAFISQISADGSTLLWSTYLGGNATDGVNALQVDGNGSWLLGGSTSSTNFPTTPGAFQTGSNGGGGGFVAKFGNVPTGQLSVSATDLSTGAFTFSASATSPSGPIQSVSFVLDGSSLQSVTTQPYAVTVDSASLSEGLHHMAAFATDSGGTVGYMQPNPLSFTVDRTAPSGTVSASLTLGTFTFTASPTDNLSPIQRVTFYLDGAFYKSIYAPPYKVTVNGTVLADGTHTLSSYAVDGVGNLGYLQPKFLNFTVEHTPPTGTATITGTSGYITFSATATDNSGIQRVTFYVDGVFVASDYYAPYSVAFDSRGLSNGAHTLVVYAVDNMGNLGYLTHGIAFTVNNTTTDSVPPSISNVAVTGTTGTVTLGAMAKDDHIVMKVEFYVDGALKGTDTSYSSPTGYSVTWLSTPGNHTLVVKATDGAGNVGTSASYPFTTN
ncbi:MAG TPA: Ig-like domain-containing protein [Holophagaceae bacterium]|nr:Ig-like domain-containing protein [Holophagaceae bacterium]